MSVAQAPGAGRLLHPARRAQRLHVRRRASVVRVREPEVAARQRRDQLIDAEQARRIRHGRNDAQRNVVTGIRLGARTLGTGGVGDRLAIVAERFPGRSPGIGKGASMSATAGPRTSTPVSRHGSRWREGSPAHIRPTQSPVTKPIVRSTAIILR